MGFRYQEKSNYCIWLFDAEVIEKDLVERFFKKFTPCPIRLTVIDLSKVKKINDDAYALLIENLRKAMAAKLAVLCSEELLGLLETAELHNCVFINRASVAESKHIDENAFSKFEHVMISSLQTVFKNHLKVDMIPTEREKLPQTGNYSAFSYLTVGPFLGGIVLDFSTTCLQGITKKILGKEEKDQAVLSDCACEVLNWTLGGAKSVLVDAGYKVIGDGPPKALLDGGNPLSADIGSGLVSATIFDTSLGLCQIRTFAKNK